ncbi:MAG: damage-inducible protein DinB [Bacteroidetes bacterium 43-16]|nr:MAG: damage-inducible protein DinB [Bacteroidetes bacterium 43-16]
MGLKQALLIEVERETENTRKMISRIEDGHLAFKPHEKSMSMLALARHIVELHSWVGEILSKDALDFHSGYTPLRPATVSELLEALKVGYEHNIARLQEVNEEEWEQTWSLKAGAHTIASMPRKAAIRYIVQNHLIHHRGQLSVYLRLNDIPVPGLYGPSADDPR